MERTLSVFLKLMDDDRFEVIVKGDESGLTETFTENTPNIEEKIGVEVMCWLDMMTYDKE